MKRNVYLHMKSLTEARRILFDHFGKRYPLEQTEKIDTARSSGRVLPAAAAARFSSPHFHGAAMDGYAVFAADTFKANETHPVTLKPGKNIFPVNTGNPLPSDTDAVIMVENIQENGKGEIIIEAPVFPWQNVRRIGEDIVATEQLFPRNHRITPYCIGALISGGVFSVVVRTKPRVLVIPTGNEVVDWQHPEFTSLEDGEVLESNSHVLIALIDAWGGVADRHPVVGDDPDGLRNAIENAAASYDMILTVGGSSAGSRDYTKKAVAALGTVLVHGVTIMPGKPIVIGEAANKPVLGIPGYPVSAIIAFEQFAGPLLCRMLGVDEPARQKAVSFLSRQVPSKPGVEEFLRVKLGIVGDRMIATPLPRGAGSITSLTEAHGILRIPENLEGIKAGERVSIELLTSESAVSRTIVVVGSHDNTLDILADQMRAGEILIDQIRPDQIRADQIRAGQIRANQIRADQGNITLSSSHVGSLGGLMALKNGGCHAAGSHLLDPETGTYNTVDIKRYLPDTPVTQLRLVRRDQGLIVAGGNPKKLQGIEDLVREDIRFINRQGGSGTRILLDARLKELGLSSSGIIGYQTEEFTHMAVAAAVAGGAVDAGLGIYAAAKALGLDFIPVVTEDYDLIILKQFMETPNIQMMMSTIKSEAFKNRVKSLGGYHVENTGKVIWQSD